MSITSMTGFGRGEASDHGVKVTVELSSVNRKQFECHLSLPRNLGALEAKLYAQIQKGVRRGQVKGSVQISTTPQAAATGGLQVDVERAKAQLNALRQAGQELGIKNDFGITHLFELDDVVKFDALPEDTAKIWPALQQAAQEALINLQEMRSQEGAELARDLKRRFKSLRTLRERAFKRAALVPAKFRDTLARRLQRMDEEIAVEPDLLARELVIFADRTDVSEELTRLKSHLDQADKLLASNEAVGRSLDFLCQELLREINTVGSKANDASLAKIVITFKAKLETIREQVQNVE